MNGGKLSDRLNSLSLSATIAMAQKSRELQDAGIDIINLSVGEPDFHTPNHIKEAAQEAIWGNYSKYTPVPGYLSLRQAISEKLKRENSLDYNADEIVVSTGAKQAICNVFLSVINPGDEVIIPAPYWVSYIEMAKMAEGKAVIVPAGVDQGFKMTPEQLEQAITPKTKALIFSSPSNPTGAIYSKEELQSLAQVLERHPNVIVISDEIYELINYVGKHESIAQFPSIRDQVAVVGGVSKGFAMTGWRIGYLAAPLWLTKACVKLQGQYTSGTCSISQKAAEKAYRSDLGPSLEMKAAFKRRRDLVVEAMGQIEGIRANSPMGAFYLFPNVKDLFGKKYGKVVIKDSDDLSAYLLEHAHVATVSGKAFGDAECIRISYATSEERLREAMERIKSAILALK